MKKIAISAVNLRKGGTLTILRQCLSFLSIWGKANEYRIVALVHKRELADYPGIEYIEIPWAIKSWGRRLWCEYITMNQISKELGEVDLWLSLHDTTPRVKAKHQAVYCQTSFPFLRWKWSDFRFDPKIPLFAMLTRFAYRINIHRNTYLIVQQEWLREGFSKMFSLPKERFIVAPPERYRGSLTNFSPIDKKNKTYRFFFASTPDSHKNFETLCEAAKLLELEVGLGVFEVIITLNGSENKYANYIKEHWGGIRSICFSGLMDKATLYNTYSVCDCFVFPSRIETWGLPITEFLDTAEQLGENKPLILADLPYAHETARGANQVAFFPASSPRLLATIMKSLLVQNCEDNKLFAAVSNRKSTPPHAENWEELFSLLMQ